jgi:uncharacterized protein YhbP (UPF0306 family)
MAADRPPVDVPPHVLRYLAGQNILTLATASRAGVPHAATLVYVNDGLQIYYCIPPGTTTARQTAENPAVAFTIDEYSPDWSKTKGIQGRGDAQPLSDAGEIGRVVRLFRQKYPPVQNAPELAFFNNLTFFRLTPSEVSFIDNEGQEQAVAEQPLAMQYRRSLVYSVFRDLPAQQADTLAASLQTEQFQPGQVIVRQGDRADRFFIVVEGEVEVTREEDGRERPLSKLRRGQFFGEIAILRDMPRTATVRAVTPTTLLAMDRAAFHSLVAQALGTTQDFDRIIQQRLASLGKGG